MVRSDEAWIQLHAITTILHILEHPHCCSIIEHNKWLCEELVWCTRNACEQGRARAGMALAYLTGNETIAANMIQVQHDETLRAMLLLVQRYLSFELPAGTGIAAAVTAVDAHKHRRRVSHSESQNMLLCATPRAEEGSRNSGRICLDKSESHAEDVSGSSMVMCEEVHVKGDNVCDNIEGGTEIAGRLAVGPSLAQGSLSGEDHEASRKDATAKDATAKDATAKDATAKDATAKDATAKDATAGLWGVTNLCNSSEQARDKCAQVVGLFQAAVSSLSVHDQNVREAAACALKSMTQNHDANNLVIGKIPGVVVALCKLVTTGTPQELAYALGALCNVSLSACLCVCLSVCVCVCVCMTCVGSAL
jgi:hypothetical protein